MCIVRTEEKIENGDIYVGSHTLVPNVLCPINELLKNPY